MKLYNLVEELNDLDLDITEGFIIDINETDISESLLTELDTLVEATNIATTTGEDLVFVKSLKELRQKAEKIINAGLKKNPMKTAPLIAKVRYLTGRGNSEERLKNAAKGIIKGGKPVEDNVYASNKADIELMKANEEAGKSLKYELKRNQIRYKKSQKAGDYRVLTTTNLFALKIGKKVYTVKSAEDKIEKYADVASDVVITARKAATKISNKFKMKAPYIPKSKQEAKEYIIDLLIKPQSKNAKAHKARIDIMDDRKAVAKKEGTKLPKNDYAISIDSFRHGKAVVIVQLHLDKIVEGMGYEGFTASKVPDTWTDTKASWGRKVKEYKAEMKDELESMAGNKATVTLGNTGGWVTIKFTN